MLPDPLHPAIVHLPLALTLLLPLFAIGALLLLRRGVRPSRAWSLVVAFAGLLFVSAWLAVRTGEAEEERVEEVVAESAIEEHEEAAERFLWLGGFAFALTALGLAPGLAGRLGRGLGTAGVLALVFAGYQVGAAGGELVYRHGAARAYTQDALPAPTVEDGDHDDHGG